ncbi:hypothetical protein OUZ56_030154 [Daphnia magna]|uniref:Uncharacterized protein n=1 Tax=Daphnia magna TaxID=35525 RepID=A0ABQ9ZQF3_9CRUS|nr:hypothetical protein OUZ56_030154 [Daphnia magna]
MSIGTLFLVIGRTKEGGGIGKSIERDILRAVERENAVRKMEDVQVCVFDQIIKQDGLNILAIQRH